MTVSHRGAFKQGRSVRRIARKLAPGGRFALADVVEPVDPSYEVTAIDPEIDKPSKLDEQVWLEAAGMHPQVTGTHRDLVVIVASRTTSASNAATPTATS